METEDKQKQYALFEDSEEPNSEGGNDIEQPLIDRKPSDMKNFSLKRDFWTNAVITELELKGEEIDDSAESFQQMFVNISVPRNHLKLNILLRILMLIILIGNVCFVPWLRNED